MIIDLALRTTELYLVTVTLTCPQTKSSLPSVKLALIRILTKRQRLAITVPSQSGW